MTATEQQALKSRLSDPIWRLASAEHNKLRLALSQSIAHANPVLPNPQERAAKPLTENSVIFLQSGSYNAHECPELADHLRKNPTESPKKP